MNRANFVQCQLAAPLTASGVYAEVTVKGGFKPPVNQPGLLVITDVPGNPSAFEVISYTGVGGPNNGVYQINGLSRGLEGTAARAWGRDAYVYQSLTVGDLNSIIASREPAIAAGTNVQFWRGDKVWADLAATVRAVTLAGLINTTSAVIAATDTILSALGKLQAQINGLGSGKLDKDANAVSATTASKLASARSLTIGGTAKNFDGSTNLSWSLAEIGAAAGGHIHAVNQVTGLQAALDAKQNVIGFVPVQQGGGAGQGTNKVHVGWGAAGLLLQVDATDFGNGWPISISKNAATASKLASARSLTIGGTAKNFDGSTNLSWSLAEIGAAPANHAHAYVPLAGGNMSGALTAPGFFSSNWFRSTGQTGWYSETYGGGIYMVDATWVRVYNNKAFYVGNEIVATGNITAYYSDERLKENIRAIDDALGTVLSWRGVRYNANALAASYGYDREVQQVGLLAQDVEKRAPELVAPAPFDIDGETGGSLSGEHYKTLKYERAVPYLVEAIRVLEQRLAELEDRG